MEDKQACSLISQATGSIMRQSLDNSFKEECLKSLGATSTKMAEEIVYDRLMKLVGKVSSNDSHQLIHRASDFLSQELPQNQRGTVHNEVCSDKLNGIEPRKHPLSQELDEKPASKFQSRLTFRGLQNSAPL